MYTTFPSPPLVVPLPKIASTCGGSATTIFAGFTPSFLYYTLAHLFFKLPFSPLQNTLELFNNTTKAHEFCTLHFILEISKKLSLYPPLGKISKLHFGLVDRFDSKFFRFNPKSLKGCSTYEILVLRTLHWCFRSSLCWFGFSSRSTVVPKIVPNPTSFDT